MALRQWKKNKVWIWRAIDGISRESVGYVLGDRTDKTLKTLVQKVDTGKCTFVTDHWEGVYRCLPQERHITGKDLTYPIEQTNSDIRHRLARFKRKTKASSRSVDMVQKSLKLFHFFQDKPQNIALYVAPLLAFFS